MTHQLLTLTWICVAAALPTSRSTPAARQSAAAPARAPGGAPGARVRWIPERAKQGSLVQLEVRLAPGDSGAAVRGELAGEPLHFEHRGAGRFRALAAIPIDAADALATSLVVERASGSRTAPETLAVRLPLARGVYPMERLRVAPQFGVPPDSALAARIDSEAALARDVGRRAHESPRLWRAAFIRPRPSRVTSGFGRGREFNGVVQSRHMGVDFAGKKGAPVRAANRGVVALVADFYLGGRVVYIDHGAGLVTGYFHLSRVAVAEGDTVARGAVIGSVGATGRVTGPHLHWIARYGAVTVDPMTLLTLGRGVSAASPETLPQAKRARPPEAGGSGSRRGGRA
jgi:Peptidase family M23